MRRHKGKDKDRFRRKSNTNLFPRRESGKSGGLSEKQQLYKKKSKKWGEDKGDVPVFVRSKILWARKVGGKDPDPDNIQRL